MAATTEPVPSLTDKSLKTSVRPVNTGAIFLILKSVVNSFRVIHC
jgi:hypothetical protein